MHLCPVEVGNSQMPFQGFRDVQKPVLQPEGQQSANVDLTVSSDQ